MTCSLSVIITERVLRPQLTSIILLSSFASCTSLFIGAESGAAIATILAAETILLKPMLINFMPFASLNILDLLADLFQLRLHLHHQVGDAGVTGLRADRIGFAVHFLH